MPREGERLEENLSGLYSTTIFVTRLRTYVLTHWDYGLKEWEPRGTCTVSSHTPTPLIDNDNEPHPPLPPPHQAPPAPTPKKTNPKNLRWKHKMLSRQQHVFDERGRGGFFSPTGASIFTHD